ncbi:glycosyltransferase family 4 protein [Tardiphaga alba]
MARAARDAGFNVHVATRVGAKADAIRAEGFELHSIPFHRGSRSPFAALAVMLAIRKIENNIQPAIIHHVGLQSCVLGGLAALGARAPQVNALTGLGYAFTGEASRARFLRSLMSVLLRFLLNRRHTVVLVQNPDDQSALERIGVRNNQIALISGSGVDTDMLRSMPEPDGAITVGFAGRLLTDKGIRALVAAHRLLRSGGLDVELLIAGEPDPANPASVSFDEAKAWTNEPGISWLGRIDDIATLWQCSHIAALPSHREGLPKSLLEAAACGRPMVATDVPGCREITIHERTGFLVPVEDPPALAQAIRRLAESQELRHSFGKAARDMVVARMSAVAIGQQTVDLYRKLLSRQKQGIEVY